MDTSTSRSKECNYAARYCFKRSSLRDFSREISFSRLESQLPVKRHFAYVLSCVLRDLFLNNMNNTFGQYIIFKLRFYLNVIVVIEHRFTDVAVVCIVNLITLVLVLLALLRWSSWRVLATLRNHGELTEEKSVSGRMKEKRRASEEADERRNWSKVKVTPFEKQTKLLLMEEGY